MIHIYYGYGKGKTCSAIGAGIRATGAGMKVIMAQFLKDDKSSELGALPFDVVDAPSSLPFNPSVSAYKPWVDNAIEQIEHSDADVIILDEFLDAVGEYVDLDKALSILAGDREYIITGHKRVDELFEAADYITHFEKEKHPFDMGIKARKGIEF